MSQSTTVSQSGLSRLVHNLASCNVWAHKRYVAWLQPKEIALLERTVPSSFASIKQTLIHIWATERFWLSVLQQVPPPPWMNDFDGTTEEVFTGLLQQSLAFEQYVQQQDEAALQEDRILDRPWGKGVHTQYDFITHCMSHSAYHRGQVVTIGRNVGIEDAPITDYAAYLMMPG